MKFTTYTDTEKGLTYSFVKKRNKGKEETDIDFMNVMKICSIDESVFFRTQDRYDVLGFVEATEEEWNNDIRIEEDKTIIMDIVES